MSKRGERETLFIKGRKKVSCNGKVNELGIKGKKGGVGGSGWEVKDRREKRRKRKKRSEGKC